MVLPVVEMAMVVIFVVTVVTVGVLFLHFDCPWLTSRAAAGARYHRSRDLVLRKQDSFGRAQRVRAEFYLVRRTDFMTRKQRYSLCNGT